MSLSTSRIILLISLITLSAVTGTSQVLRRSLAISEGGELVISNNYGRVTVKTNAGTHDVVLLATGSSTLSDTELKTAGMTISVVPSGRQDRVDLDVTIPERMRVKVETSIGQIEFSGNFASIDARTDTGTIVTDVPPTDVSYSFVWTESRPRFMADFEISKVKERSAGRFEIKGQHIDSKPSAAPNGAGSSVDESVSLNFTTARGIILLNVPPNQVAGDLRERPLTDAAKAIVRSGDSLLMEAIRRASPRYFGEYETSLRPFEREPAFARSRQSLDQIRSEIKTASVRVADLNNRSIAGLGPSDFEVVENGVSRQVLSVEPSTAPFNLVLLLDVSGSVDNYVDFIRKTARRFVETVDPRDRVSIVTFNSDVKVISTFTTDKKKLSESLDTFDAGGGTAYYDALAYVIADTLRPLRGERTAVVILTDGDDNRSFLSFDALMGSIQESGALIYPLYVPSELLAAAAQNTDIDPLRQRYMSLTAKSTGEGEKLARISGGVYYQIDEVGQLQKAYEDIVRQLRSAYNVTFRSDAAMASEQGALPHLKIRALRPDTVTSISSVVAAK